MRKGIHVIRALYSPLSKPRRPRLVGLIGEPGASANVYAAADRELIELQEFQRRLESACTDEKWTEETGRE